MAAHCRRSERGELIHRLLASWDPLIGTAAVRLIMRHLWHALPTEVALRDAAHIEAGGGAHGVTASLITMIALDLMAGQGDASDALAHWRRDADGRHTIAGHPVPPSWHLQLRAVWREVSASPAAWSRRYLPVCTTTAGRTLGCGELLVSIGGVRLDPPVCMVGDGSWNVDELLYRLCLSEEIDRGSLMMGVAALEHGIQTELGAEYRATYSSEARSERDESDVDGYPVYYAHLRLRLLDALRSALIRP